jgi:isopenicillin N synthase-like dioxygenase
VTTRAINYERAPGAPDPEPGQMRMGAHTDYGVLTVLLADDQPGLQVFRDDRWHDVAAPRGTFVCNLGDMLERWTNDRWTSTLHRVVPRTAHRRALARFLDCPPDLVVETIPTCITADRPARYEPVNAGAWLRAKVMGGRGRAAPDLGTAHA